MASTEWERRKATILHLYMIENRSLKAVAEYMKHNHQFDMHEHQYEYRLKKKWGVTKYAKRKAWEYVAHEMKKREGKATRVLLYGNPVSEDKLHRELVRYDFRPTASDYGRRPPSPVNPGIDIVRIQTPTIVEYVVQWPNTLPWFTFTRRISPILPINHSALLKRFFSAGDSTELSYDESNRSSWKYFALFKNPPELRKAMLLLAQTIPVDPTCYTQDVDAQSATPTSISLSLATTILKVMFYRLANNMDRPGDEAARRMHDQFVIRMVEAVASDNPELLSVIISGSCETTQAIKEAVYGCAVREKNYAIVSSLLQSGLNPDLPVDFWCESRIALPDSRRGMIPWTASIILDHKPASGLTVAVISRDVHLVRILLQAGARVNLDPESSLLAILASNADETTDDAVELTRLLLDHGASIDTLTTAIIDRRDREGIIKLSALEIAILTGFDRMADLFITRGARRHFSRRERRSTTSQLCGIFPDFNIIESPLTIAIATGSRAMIKLLLEPIISTPSHAYKDVIKEAILTSCLVGDSVTVEQLLKVDIDLVDGWASHGITPLAAAAWNPDLTISQALLAAGALPCVDLSPGHNHRSTSWPSALHVAAYHGISSLARQLIERGADCDLLLDAEQKTAIFERDDESHQRQWSGDLATPLHLALMSCDLETIGLLLPRSSLVGGEYVQAVLTKEESVINAVASLGANVLDVMSDGTTLLEAAVETNNADIALLCLSSGGLYSSSALHHAAVAAVVSQDFSMVELLTSHRPAGPIDRFEASCLVLAISKHSWDLLRLLLSDPFLPSPSESCYEFRFGFRDTWAISYFSTRFNTDRVTPLSAAFLSCDTDIINAVIIRGYILRPEDIRQWIRCRVEWFTDTLYSAVWSLVVPQEVDLTCRQLMLLYAIDTNHPKEVEYMIGLLSNLDFEDSGLAGGGPVCRAAKNGYKQICNLLLDHGAYIEFLGRSGRALETAAENDSIDMVKHLVDRGAKADPPLRLKVGATALQYAAINGNVDMARILIDHGADTNALPANFRGRTALEGAAENGRLDMVQLLLENGAKAEGDMRIYYVRSVVFAKWRGHHVLAAYLRRRCGWSDGDEGLHQRPHTLRDGVMFRYDEELHDWRIWTTKGNGEIERELLDDSDATSLFNNSDASSEDADSIEHDVCDDIYRQAFDGCPSFETVSAKHVSEGAMGGAMGPIEPAEAIPRTVCGSSLPVCNETDSSTSLDVTNADGLTTNTTTTNIEGTTCDLTLRQPTLSEPWCEEMERADIELPHFRPVLTAGVVEDIGLVLDDDDDAENVGWGSLFFDSPTPRGFVFED